MNQDDNGERRLTAFSEKRPPLTEPPPPMELRPCCPQCGMRLRPYITSVRETFERDVVAIAPGWERDRPNEIRHERVEKTVARRWSGRYDAYGYFCTRRCAVEYANKQLDRPGVKRPGARR